MECSVAYENIKYTVPGLQAGADLSAKQFYFVKNHTTAKQVVVAGDGEAAIGVLQDKPDAAGKSATVAVAPSTSKVVAGGAISAGAKVASDAAGKAATAASGEYVQGFALDASTADGDLITVQLAQIGRIA
jgi:hypothetical protein